MLDFVKATGVVNIYDAAGKLVQSNNTVLTLGKEWIAQRCTGQITSLVTQIGVGTSSTPVSVSDAGLGAEIARVALASAGAVDPQNKAIIRYSASFVEGVATGGLTEAGLFTAANVCVARTVFSVKNKGADDVFTVVWEITIN